MDYDHYQLCGNLGYMMSADFAELCRKAGCVRPYMPVLDGVQDCGIFSWRLDKKGPDQVAGWLLNPMWRLRHGMDTQRGI